MPPTGCGNTLAYVITGAGVTQDIGLRMVSEGFATASYPEGETAPKRFEQYATSSKIAVEQKDRIWAGCPAPKV
jgi:endonuclease YncB( thermonuclease family)